MDEQTQISPISTAKPRRSRVPMFILAVVVIGGALFAGITAWLGRNQESTDDAFTDGHAILMMSQDSGAIVDVRARDNQFVHQGDLLAVIDQRNYQAELDQARGDLAKSQAQLVSARIQLARAKILYPAELAAARAELASAQAQYAKARADAARQHNVPREATSVQSIDQADAAALQAKAAVAQAQAQVDEADVVDQNIGVAAASVSELEADVVSQQAKLSSAFADFANSSVVAPHDGWVTKKDIEVGTFVQPGTQLFQIVTPEVYVTANFKEAQLDRMRPGDDVTIKVDAYPSLHLKGHVDSIQLGTGSRFTAFPAENATGNFVKIVQRVPVKIDIDSGLDPNLPLSLGLSVEPVVTVK